MRGQRLVDSALIERARVDARELCRAPLRLTDLAQVDERGDGDELALLIHPAFGKAPRVFVGQWPGKCGRFHQRSVGACEQRKFFIRSLAHRLAGARYLDLSYGPRGRRWRDGGLYN